MSSLPVVLLFAPLSFGLIPVSTGTAVCNGSNVSLDYTSLFNSSGTVINFTIDVLSISGATIDSVTCSGGAAIYALSGSQFTVTFGPPIIGTDTTTYTNVFGTISFSRAGSRITSPFSGSPIVLRASPSGRPGVTCWRSPRTPPASMATLRCRAATSLSIHPVPNCSFTPISEARAKFPNLEHGFWFQQRSAEWRCSAASLPYSPEHWR